MFCTKCGKEINDQAVICVHCGESTINRPKHSSQGDAALRMVLPVGRSGYAIAAGYLGLFSVLLIFAPFAILFGILGMMEINKNKEKHGMGRAVFGIIMGSICTIILIVKVISVMLH